MHFTRRLCSYYKKYLIRTMTDPHYHGQSKDPRNVTRRPHFGLKGSGLKRPWYYGRDPPYTSSNVHIIMTGKKPEGSNIRPFHKTKPYKYPVIFSGDRVQITKGEDKGKQGVVEEVVRETGKIYVAGLNLEYEQHEDAVIYSKSSSLYLDNGVSLIDPGDEKPTRVQWRYNDSGEMIRVSARTGRHIPLPKNYYDIHEDGTHKPSFKATLKDTKEAEVTKKTFVPSTLTFEEDLMQKLNIKEDKKKTYKTYWY